MYANTGEPPSVAGGSQEIVMASGPIEVAFRFWGVEGQDNPHALQPGQELNILPVNGTYYEWQDGDGLNGVSTFFHVTPEDIINYPGNNLNPETIGDLAHPNIAPGTILIVPGGTREFVSWLDIQ